MHTHRVYAYRTVYVKTKHGMSLRKKNKMKKKQIESRLNCHLIVVMLKNVHAYIVLFQWNSSLFSEQQNI